MMIKVEGSGFIDDTVKLIGDGRILTQHAVEIRAYSVIEMANGSLSMGTGSVIGYNSMLQGSGTIIIGEGSLLGPHTTILASAHPINDLPLRASPLIRGIVTIGNNVWIGANCVIDTNVTIGDNAIIGANSFVKNDVPPNEIYAGSPARKIRDR